MRYGHFDDLNREYVITDPKTPWPWINYLGMDDFHSLISNTAGGYAFCRDAKFRRLLRYRYNSVPADNGGRYFYIADGDTVWNPGWKPVKTPLDRYECRHGLNYTRMTGERDGVCATELFFVPRHKNAEVCRLTLTNLTDKRKQLKLFSFVEWCLWNAQTDMENFQRNLSTGEVEIEGSTLYHTTEYRERRDHFAFYHVNTPVDGFDTDREAFTGLYNGFDQPDAVLEGKSRNSVAHGWSPIASHMIQVELRPGESRDFIFVLGYVENDPDDKWEAKGVANKRKAHELIESLNTVEKVEAEFERLRSDWDSLLSTFRVSSPEPEFDRTVNLWNQYQCMITFLFSRSASFFESGIGRGMGFRDSNQDLVGFVHQIPSRARARILDIAATQFADGSCYHQYQPLTKRGNNDIGAGFNDDPLWLIFGTVAYLRETGDFTILDEMVPFDNQPGTERTLLDHLRVSFRYVAENLGPHGLPLIGRADWNDCLNLNCFSDNPDESYQTTENVTEGTQAESLMIAGQFVTVGRDFAALLRQLHLDEEAGEVEGKVREMEQSVTEHGWDGEWYLRAYDYCGNPVGSSTNREGKIFIESQGWCAMARIGESEGIPDKALDAVVEHLECPQGIVLNSPAFTEWVKAYGEISSYPPGYKENAGVFAHNNPWVIIAETMARRSEDAWRHYRLICPAYLEDRSDLRRMEPYVYAQMTAGRDAATPGEAKNSWLTGTAAWNWLAATQYMLGIRPGFDSLVIDPVIPAEWPGFSVERKWRGATYRIKVTNQSGEGHGVKSLTLDGVPVTGNVLPAPLPGVTHNVEVRL